MSLAARGKLAGIIGWPVGHSLSPRLHGFWLRDHAVDGVYVPLAIPREQFGGAMASLRRAGFVGVNVTVPHKEAAAALAHELDATAQAAGAANVLLFQGDRYVGRNTDVEGLAASLVEALGSDGVRGAKIVVLGAGGAARAATLACDRLRAQSIDIFSRQVGRAENLVASLKPQVRARLTGWAWSNELQSDESIRLLINATSAGMKGTAPLELDLASLHRDMAVCDLVYNPLETELLKGARARGLQTIDGLGMLMHQAVPAFEAFYGIRPRISPALRSELEAALRHGN
jgi:shikimate dehydrogenase